MLDNRACHPKSNKHKMQDVVPVLTRICSNGKKYVDAVLLNVNHDMKNIKALLT